MPKQLPVASGDGAEVRVEPVAEKPTDGKSTVEDLALELGYVDVTTVDPKTRRTVVVKDAGATNRMLFAAAKARKGWPVGMRLTKAQFEDAIAEHTDPNHPNAMKFGDHPPVEQS